jgi:hypothetical protein
MDAARRRVIYLIVRKQVLGPMWRDFRSARLQPIVSPLEMLPIRPEEFIQRHLQYNLEKPEEIVPDIPMSTEIGGVLDRALRRVVVAGKLPLVLQRFTLAHEIGHYFLHPDLVYHRDLPVAETGHEDRTLPPAEREASYFASEVLMPRRLVADIFHTRYGPRIHPDDIGASLAFGFSRVLRLPLGDPRQIIERLRSMSRHQRARLVARDDRLGLSLSSIFAVSPESMAIRLEHLDLVF